MFSRLDVPSKTDVTSLLHRSGRGEAKRERLLALSNEQAWPAGLLPAACMPAYHFDVKWENESLVVAAAVETSGAGAM